MTDEQKAAFLTLSSQHLDLLKDLYQQVQWKFFQRVVTSSFFIPQALLDSVSGVPSSAKSALRTAEIALQTLTEMAPLVPYGGPPHGVPENWASVWVDLAQATEKNLYTTMGVLNRTAAFASMMEMWRRYFELIKRALGGAGQVAQSVSGAAMMIAGLLILRELLGRRK